MTTLAQSFVVNSTQVDQFGYRVLLIKNTNNSKSEFGFTTYLQKFTIYEGMFSKFMYCEGQIFDGASFLQKVGLQAGDCLRISLYKDTSDVEGDMITNDYFIDSLGAGTRLVGGKGETFTFRAVSKIGTAGLRSKLKRSFNGKASDIIQFICNKIFELEPGKVKPENIEETSGSLSLIASSVTPFEFIESVNSQAISSANKAKDNNFFFYETRDGVVYKSLRKIVKDSKSYKYVVPVDKNRNPESQAKDYYRILEYQVKTFNDQRAKVEQGVMENQTLTFDFISRKITKQSFKLKNSYKDILLLGDNLAFDVDEIDNLVGENTVTDDEQNILPRCSNRSYDQPEDFISIKRGPTQAQYFLMNQTILSCRILGNPKLKPGDTINIEASQPSASADREMDAFLSGNFLITSLRHIVMDAGSYETIVDLFKDGYEFDISNYRKDTNSNLINQRQ